MPQSCSPRAEPVKRFQEVVQKRVKQSRVLMPGCRVVEDFFIRGILSCKAEENVCSYHQQSRAEYKEGRTNKHGIQTYCRLGLIPV